MYIKFLSENLKERDHTEDPGIDGKIILEWVLRKYGARLDSSALWQGPVVGPCKHGNEPSGSLKGGEFFWLAKWQLASQEDSAPWGQFFWEISIYIKGLFFARIFSFSSFLSSFLFLLFIVSFLILSFTPLFRFLYLLPPQFPSSFFFFLQRDDFSTVAVYEPNEIRCLIVLLLSWLNCSAPLFLLQ